MLRFCESQLLGFDWNQFEMAGMERKWLRRRTGVPVVK